MTRLGWFKRRRSVERDFQEELRAHLAIADDDRVADGADRRSAQLASLKDFGNVTLTTEAARSVWIPWWVDALRDLASDVRHAVRTLAKNPGFSLTVIAPSPDQDRHRIAEAPQHRGRGRRTQCTPTRMTCRPCPPPADLDDVPVSVQRRCR